MRAVRGTLVRPRGRAGAVAPARGDPAELPAADGPRLDLAFERDMEYIKISYLHDGTIQS